MSLPKVSIILCAYNAENFIQETIEAILNQSFKQFELIIINDGSSDATGEIINTYYDNRIIGINHEINLGLIQSIRDGIKLSRGDYISKIDADDIPAYDLIERQVRILDQSPKVGIVGVGFLNIDTNGKELFISRRSADNTSIQWNIMFGSPITHSGVMIRKEILIQNTLDYQEEFLHAEDYDLWSRLLDFCEGRNIKQPLIKRRIHKESISNRHKNIQFENHLKISKRTIEKRYPYSNLSLADVKNLIIIEQEKNLEKINSDRNFGKLIEFYLSMLKNYKFKCDDKRIYNYFVLNKIRSLTKKLFESNLIWCFLPKYFCKAAPLFFRSLFYYFVLRRKHTNESLELKKL